MVTNKERPSTHDVFIFEYKSMLKDKWEVL